MEARQYTDQELEELQELFGVETIIEPSYADDYTESLDGYFDLGEENYRLYATQRGRTCEYPGCARKLRYTRRVPVCRHHSTTEFAELHPASDERPRGGGHPRLAGLRAARERRGMSTREIAQICGRSQKWVNQVERERNGVTPELRALLAAVLNVSEAELLEGEWA